ncbi:hypothetical protein KPH14_008466 [Odynerus spinipes]|uniref:PIH1 domain-containing protein 1 n=1 Tax=Odynerus spinipes TaxID=1348599 RepID=A0AAD9RE88_9HYME|nr:hypothetical protein KPH14_008466 [Odynerus spinipes]
MSDKTLLDIDDTILTKNLLLPENKNEQGIDDILKQLETKSKYIVVHPSPGSCIKTRLNTGEKVFLNVCTSTKIPPPEDITEEKLFSLLDDETPAFAIPMSIGEERLEADKGGIPCITHDVIINKDYFEKCQTKQSFWLFTISVIMEGVSNKYNRCLDSKTCSVLKNRKVMGTLKPQRIEDREVRKMPLQLPKPLIQEISSSSKIVHDNIITSVQSQNNHKEPSTRNYVILKEPSRGVINRLIGLFQIPKDVSTKDLIVLVDTDRVVVTANENKLAYDIGVPYTININEIESFFDKDLRVLRLNMPVYTK